MLGRDLGVPAEIGGRNDILADGRKISGNAQFATAGRMFSHGTLLLDSNLDDVTAALRAQLREEFGVGAWNVAGALYGTAETVAAARKVLRRSLPSFDITFLLSWS